MARSMFLAVSVAGAILVAGGAGWVLGDRLIESRSAPAAAAIGGPFKLVDPAGQRVTEADFRGKVMLIYFGYTHCPDACPMALQTMTEAIEQAGPVADKVVPVFITLDPERDQPAVLADYAKHFHPRTRALTGSAQEIAEAARVFRVYFRKNKAEADGSYMVDHSSIIYLMGPDGRFLTHFTHESKAEQIAAALKRLG